MSGSLTNDIKGLLFSLKGIFTNYKYLSPKIKLILFNSVIESILTYGCEIWGSSEAKDLDTVHLKFFNIFFVLGVARPLFMYTVSKGNIRSL